MIKKWNQFNIINENNHQIVPVDYYEIRDEIQDNFYFLSDKKSNAYLSSGEFYWIDDTNYFREDIKVGESLNPSIIIKIVFSVSGGETKIDEETFNQIKFAIKKLKSIFKFKYKLKLNTKILHPYKMDFYEKVDMSRCELTDSSKDPFDGLKLNGEGGYEYKDGADGFNMLLIYLKQEEKVLTTPLNFAIHYRLRDYITKGTDIYAKIPIKQIALDLFDDYDAVSDWYEPTNFQLSNYPNVDYDSIKEQIESKVLHYVKEKMDKEATIIVDGDTSYIEIKFDPSVFIEYYDEEEDPEFWSSEWGNALYNNSVYDMVIEHFEQGKIYLEI